MQINEKTLPRLLLGGMLLLVLLVTISLGGYFTHQQLKQADLQSQKVAEEVRQKHKNFLQAEIASTTDYITFTRQRTEEVLKAQIRSQTDQAFQVAQGIWEREKSHRPTAEIRQLIVEALRPVRFFDGRGYIFIDDTDGNCVLLPTAPKLEGTSLWNNQDDSGHYIMRGLVEATQNPNAAGFSRYRWYAPDSPKEMREKVAYARHFKPLNWVIGTGEYLYKVEEDLQREALARIKARRFGNDGYISVIRLLADGDVEIVANPTSANVGKRLSQLPPESIEAKLLHQLRDTAKNGGGFKEYEWKHPNANGYQRKLSQISPVLDWGWVLIAGVYL